MEVVEFGPMTPELRAELEGDEDDPFEVRGITLRYRPKERHVVLRDADGRHVSSAGLVLADAEVAGRRFPVVGLGGVLVRASHRGRGLAREVVSAALAVAETLGPEFVVLFCHDDRAGLYRKLGFLTVDAEVSVRQPDGYAGMPQVTMWRALRASARWPDGPLTLQTLPF
jgi:predicted N-acetyltransferase YhbS